MLTILGTTTLAPTTSMATTSEGTEISTLPQAPIPSMETTSEGKEISDKITHTGRMKNEYLSLGL